MSLIKITEPLMTVELRKDAGSTRHEFASYREADAQLRDWSYIHTAAGQKAEYLLTWANGMTYEGSLPLERFGVTRKGYGLAPHVRAELYAQACGPCEGALAQRTLYARQLVDLCDTGKTEDLEQAFTLRVVCHFRGMTQRDDITLLSLEHPIPASEWFWTLVDSTREMFVALYAVEPEQVTITRE